MRAAGLLAAMILGWSLCQTLTEGCGSLHAYFLSKLCRCEARSLTSITTFSAARLLVMLICIRHGRCQHLSPASLTLATCHLLQEELEQGPLIPLATMAYKEQGQTYTVLRRPPEVLAGGKLEAVLHFKVKEIDPSTGDCDRSAACTV